MHHNDEFRALLWIPRAQREDIARILEYWRKRGAPTTVRDIIWAALAEGLRAHAAAFGVPSRLAFASLNVPSLAPVEARRGPVSQEDLDQVPAVTRLPDVRRDVLEVVKRWRRVGADTNVRDTVVQVLAYGLALRLQTIEEQGHGPKGLKKAGTSSPRRRSRSRTG